MTDVRFDDDAPFEAWPPDPRLHPDYYNGIAGRRVVAYLIDVVIIGIVSAAVWLVLGVAVLLTFGLLAPIQALIVFLVPFAYHTWLIGGPGSATLGMRLAGVRVFRILDGKEPDLVQAAVQTVIFYATVPTTGGVMLLFAMLNPERRTLHDYLSGMVVLRNRSFRPS